MASVQLAMDNFMEIMNDEQVLPDSVLHDLTQGLDVTFDLETGWTNDFGASHLEFTGPHADLIDLIDRYEEDEGLRSDLYSEITCRVCN